LERLHLGVGLQLIRNAAAGEAKRQPPAYTFIPSKASTLVENNTMRKVIISAVAIASILAAATTANAGYWVNGIYVPTCGYVGTIYGPVWTCG
jgi:hypothetical protein